MSGPSSSRTEQDRADPLCRSSRLDDPTPGMGRSITYFFMRCLRLRWNSCAEGRTRRSARASPRRAIFLSDARVARSGHSGLDQPNACGVGDGGSLRADVELEPDVREMP